ncbi:MAG: tetratricopeptide repeat protein [Deltaproteobacteria bacterium]|nr:tetratricopeptide repeat protein [Deltaproteobacteria bacterium]
MPSARLQLLKAAVFASLMGAICLWIYAPALHGLPIWDDNEALFQYPLIASPFSSLSRIWFSHQAPDFWPLHYSWFFKAYRWWGLDTYPYHLTNVVLHTCNALLWAALLRTLRLPLAWICAVIFAVHPVNTEAVAWIVQFKTLASSCLCLASWLTFLKFLTCAEQVSQRARMSMYFGSMLLFGAALLTKSAVVFAPLVQAAATWVITRDLRRSIKLSTPFFILALVSGVIAVTWYAPDHLLPAGEHLNLGPLSERIARAGWNFWFYLKQALWPTQIAFIYPKIILNSASLPYYLPTMLAALLPFGAWALRRRLGYGPFAGVLYYGVALAPALGIYGIYFMRFAFVADHWQYMALIAPITAVVNTAARILRLKLITWPVLGIVTLTLALMTRSEARHFVDEEAIWQQTLVHNPDSWLAHNNLGKVLMGQSKLPEAERHYLAALAAKPDFRDAINNLGAVYIAQGRLAEAVNILERAVVIWPDFAAARSNLGVALTRSGDYAAALVHLKRATELAPEDASYHKNLGFTEHRLHQVDGAIASYERAIALAPKADLYSDLGQLLREAKRHDDAIKALSTALLLDPRHGLAMANLGFVYMTQMRLNDALHWLRRAAAASPDSASVQLALASCLVEAGELSEAAAALKLARQIAPEQPGTADVARRIEASRRQGPDPSAP